jgi:anti-sigma factor RsiW
MISPEDSTRLLQAYVDGELDATSSVELEAHLARDPAARAAYERLRALSEAIRSKTDYHYAPAGLDAGIRHALPVNARKVRQYARWSHRSTLTVSIAAAVVLTWVTATAWLRPDAQERVMHEALAGHVRAALTSRVTDVATSDEHTVKPWMSARLAYSPPVVDLSARGFPLAGGRLDYLDGRTVAVLVYRRRQHVIDVYVWPAAADVELKTFARDGFNVLHFAGNGLAYWLVSDLNARELGDLAQLLAHEHATH